MNTEYPFVVEVVRQFRNRLIELVDLGPINGIEEHRTENAFPEFGSSVRGDVIRQELRSNLAKLPTRRPEEALDRHFVKRPQMAAERRRVHHVATNEMLLPVSAGPLQIEEMIAAEWKGPEQDNVRIHPQSAMLIEHRITENIAEIPDLRAGEYLLEHPTRHDVGCGSDIDAAFFQEFELFRRIGPHPHRMPSCPHRRSCGNQGAVFGALGEHLVKAMNLRQRGFAPVIQEWRDPRIEFARRIAPLGR